VPYFGVGGLILTGGLQVDGRLELHIPSAFTKERPAIAYTHATHSIPIESHEVGSKIPKASAKPAMFLGPPDFRQFAAPGSAPETLDDYLFSDRPQIGLHVTSFTDVTLVAISWPHITMDVMGLHALVKAWSCVLNGREDEVAPALGAKQDVVRQILDASDRATEEVYALQDKRLKGWGMAKFGLRFAGDLLLWNRVMHTRTMYLPRTAIEALTAQTKSDTFVSEGDVLTAWTLRALAQSLPSPRPITALHALNARFRLPALKNAQGVYIQNLAVAAFTSVPASVATGPLSGIASLNRTCLAAQATAPQVLSYLRAVDDETADPATMLFCDAEGVLMPFTNWTRAALYETVDFSGAVVGEGSGRMRFHHAGSMREMATTRNVVVILGRDMEGGVWIVGTLTPGTWKVLEGEMEGLV
jgi:hypothetical protein